MQLKQLVPSWKRLALMIPYLMLMSFTYAGNVVTKLPEGDTTTAIAKDFKTLLVKDTVSVNPLVSPVMFKLNPNAIPFVEDYLATQGKELLDIKEWGKPYFEIYDKVLGGFGLPLELKYLSVIESHLQATLRSRAGAVGPWQIMPDEAKRFGLKMTKGADERTDFYKSTVVCAQLLKELYEEFNDWLLVIAAYNGGAGRMRRAIKAAGTNDFWKLESLLPKETRNHVKKFIGTHYLMEGGGGWTTLTAAEVASFKQRMPDLIKQSQMANGEELGDSVTIEITGRYNSAIIANTILMDISLFNKLNPDFDKSAAEGRTYQLKLPADKAELFKTKRVEILKESVRVLLTQGAA